MKARTASEEAAYRVGFDEGVKASDPDIADAADAAKDEAREEVEHLKWRATLKAASSPLDPAIAAVYDEIIEALS